VLAETRPGYCAGHNGDKASSKRAINQTAGGLSPFQANWL